LAWWIANHHHLNHRGDALDFSTHQYQIDIIKDHSLDKRIRKGVQNGLSEVMILSLMSKMDLGESVFWVMPDDDLRNRFVSERVDPVINQCDYYQRLQVIARRRMSRGNQSATDARSLKQLGQAAACFVGANSPKKMREFVADHIFIDELDDCDQGVLVKAMDRIGHSKIRGKFRMGNPSTAKFGIDKLYEESDQKVWMIQCPRCNERQPLDWWKNIVEEHDDGTYRLLDNDLNAVCRKCLKPIDRKGSGEWVAKYPGRDSSGYHISQLFSGTVTIQEMLIDYEAGLRDETDRQRFFNSILGLAYRSEEVKLYRETLNRLVGTYARAKVGNKCLMGVDPGKEIHGIILDPHGEKVIDIFKCSGENKYQDLQNKINQFKALAMIDGGYDPAQVRHIQNQNRGNVFVCEYRKVKQIDVFDLDKKTKFIVASKLQSMDESHAALLAGEVALPRDAMGIPGFVDQMCAPTRVEIKRRTAHSGIVVTHEWQEGDEPDHWRHAFNYAILLKLLKKRFGSTWVRSANPIQRNGN